MHVSFRVYRYVRAYGMYTRACTLYISPDHEEIYIIYVVHACICTHHIALTTCTALCIPTRYMYKRHGKRHGTASPISAELGVLDMYAIHGAWA